MAQKVRTLFIDDIDGGQAAGTVRFALDGTEYEIDLSAKHSDEMRGVLRDYIAHARKVGGSSRRAPRGGRKPSDIDTVAARAWARENGLDIKERGRIPAAVVARYRQATGRLNPRPAPKRPAPGPCAVALASASQSSGCSGDADQVALGVGEMANHQAGR